MAYRVRLGCGHECGVDSANVFRHWCNMCGDMRDVIERLDFVARCASCRFAKWFGFAQVSAEFAADRHWRKNPTHTVEVFKGDTRISVRESGTDVPRSPAEPMF